MLQPMGTFSVLRRASIAIDRKTKQLCKRVSPGQIAVIDHPDVDEIAAEDLIEARVGAVINTSPFLSGHYPAEGARLLLKAGVPLYELRQTVFKQPRFVHEWIKEGDEAAIAGNRFMIRKAEEWIQVAWLVPFTAEAAKRKWKEATEKQDDVLIQFIANTLHYAEKEKDWFQKPLPSLPLRTRLANRPAVVVSRGKYYKEDVRMLADYIKSKHPVLIAVDGGADALLACGFRPDLIVGDMDSLSDQALQSGAEIVVHAYPNGEAPGKERVEALGLPYLLLPCPGTSEDVAMLLAYEEQAEVIVSVGTHTGMIDFLEKERKGMASTVLVRAKIGSKLIDARGVSKLIPPQQEPALVPSKQHRLLESLSLLVREWRLQRGRV